MAVPKSVALNDVAVIERNIVDPTAIENGTLYVGLENIESGGRFVGVRRVDAGELASSKFAFTSRHLLYGKLRPYLAKIARPDFEGICSTDILPVLPCPDLDRGYLAWLLLTPKMVALASSRATGANLPRLSANALEELRIPLPPLAEQRRIAEILDKADALRAKRRRALAQLDTLTQSIFLDMFGDPLAHSDRRDHVPFKTVTKRITYGFTSPMKHLESGIPIVTAKNVRDGFIDFADVHFADKSEFDALTTKSKPVRGDVLITKDGTIGRCAVVERDEPFCINQSVALVQPDRSMVLPAYLVSYLSTSRVQHVMGSMGKGNALAHLQITELAELPTPLPSLGEQREFETRVMAVEKAKMAQKESLSHLNSLVASLEDRAFRGELF